MKPDQDTAGITGTHRHRGHSEQAVRLPAGAVALLYVVVCLLPLGLAALRDVAPLAGWELAAAGLGLIGLAAMAVQFVTSGRFQIVSGRLGIDRVMAFHKAAARWVFLALLLHPLAYVVPTFLADPGLGQERLWAYLTLPHYRSGLVALGALALLVLGAVVHRHAQFRYEIWRATHLALAIAALGAGLHHAVMAGRFSALGVLHGYWWAIGGAAVAVIGILYGWRWARLFHQPWRLQSVTKLADRMWELDIQPDAGTPQLGYRAGQFVWMTEGAGRFPLLDHPFSIADSPSRPGLSLIIKEAGDFTGRIGQLAPGTAIGIDGPYGNFTLEGHEKDAIFLIAGGVGIAPIMGLLRDLLARGHTAPVRLAYAVGAPGNLACLDEIAAAGDGLDLQTLLISETDAPGWQGEIGRLDRDRLAGMLRGLDPAGTVALICGPGPMVTAVADMLVEASLPLERVIYERFDYSEGASRHDRQMRRRFMALGGVILAGLAGFVALLG